MACHSVDVETDSTSDDLRHQDSAVSGVREPVDHGLSRRCRYGPGQWSEDLARMRRSHSFEDVAKV